MTLFEKIIKGEIPSYKIYEDELVYSLLDVFPYSKGHILVVTKEPYETFTDIPDDVLQHLILVVKKIAENTKTKLGIEDYNIVMNNGEKADQTVPHAHIHIIPRYDDKNLYAKHEELGLNSEEFEDIKNRLSL